MMRKIFVSMLLLAAVATAAQVPTYRWLGGTQDINSNPVLIKTTPGPRQGPSSFTDKDGNFWLFGGIGHDFTRGVGYFDDVWKYDKNSGLWTWVDGKMTGGKIEPDNNNALRFDGVDDFVQLPDNPVDYQQDLTIEFWFKPEADGDVISYIPENIGDQFRGWSVRVVNSGTGLWLMRQFSILAEVTGLDLIDGQWHHFAYTYRARQNQFNQEEFQLLVDGVSYDISFAPLVTDFTNPVNHVTTFGAYRGDGSESFYEGEIDEVRFWDYPRTFGEIVANSSVELSGNEEGLIAYYNFNQGVANSSDNFDDQVIDITPDPINGTRNPDIFREGVFIGQMAKMRVWNSALSEAEITQNITSSLTGTETGLALGFQFDNGNAAITPDGNNTAVTTVNDISIGDDGFLSNFALIGDNSNFSEDAFDVIPEVNDLNGSGTGVAFADLNADGFDDVLASTGFGNSLDLYINDQTGKLTSYAANDVGTNARDLTVGFWNNDNFPDVAVAAYDVDGDERIRIFFGDGLGGFTSSTDITGFPAGSQPSIVRTADFDNDGNDDLLVILSGTKELQVHFGDGIGGFSEVTSVGLGRSQLNEGIDIGDVDNDGFEDVVISLLDDTDGNFCPAIGTFINDQARSFLTPIYTDQCLSSREIALTDYNGDGLLDLYNMDAFVTYLYRGDGAGTFVAERFGGNLNAVYGFDIADFDEDGRDDFVGVSVDDNSVAIYTLNEQLQFVRGPGVNIPFDSEDVLLGDLNNDGIRDVVIAHGNAKLTSIVRQGPGFTQPNQTPTLKFDGLNDNVYIPNLKVFDNSFTIEGWIKTEDNGPILAFTNNDENLNWQPGHFAFAIKNKRLHLMVNSGGEVGAFTEANVANGRWHHVAMRVNIDLLGIDNVQFYVDGVFAGSGDIEFNENVDNANGSYWARMGYATADFKDFLGSTGISPNSNWVKGFPFSTSPINRAYAAEWSDSTRLYIFGGEGVNGVYNTLRSFNTITETWTLLSGSEAPGDPGSYGIPGVPDALNAPPARTTSEGTTDLEGRLWLYGGATSLQYNSWFADFWMFDPMTNLWTWIGGSDQPDSLPTHGTLGVSAASNFPGARENHKMWTDANGDLWLFGGYGLDSQGTVGFLNDLWKYSISSGEWTWVAGSTEADQGGEYGIQGEYGANNYPGGRSSALQWVDREGIIWIFGGFGIDKFGLLQGYLNDLWSYDPATNQWAWHSGSDFKNSSGSYNEIGLTSVDYVPGARWHGTEWIDEEGDLYLFGGFQFNQVTTGRYNDLWKYDISTNSWTWLSGVGSTTTLEQVGTYGDLDIASTPFPGARHGAVTWKDDEGAFWMMGGALVGSSAFGMFTDLWKYEPVKKEWSYVRGNTNVELNEGSYGALRIGSPTNEPKSRWHGMSWSGDDGRLWFFGGLNQNLNTNETAWLNDLWVYDPDSDIYTWMGGSSNINGKAVYGIQGEASVAHFPGARSSSATWKDSEGNFWMFGGYESFKYNNDLWKFNPNTLEWTWVNGNNFQNTPSTYGELGVPSEQNEIGARRYTRAWVDRDGFVWIFGGQGFDSQGQFGYLNDLWRYDPTTNLWTWMGGGTLRDQQGVYGTKGQPDTANVPSGRYSHSIWTDDVGNLWLFGGLGMFGGDPEVFQVQQLNDLWKYDVKDNVWTWYGGSDAQTLPDAVYGTQGLFDEANQPFRRARAQAFPVTDKSIYMFGGRRNSSQSINDFWEIRFTPGQARVEDPSLIEQTGFTFFFEEPWTTAYQVQVAGSEDFSDVFLDEQVTETTLSIADLMPGTNYYYRVNSTNDIGESGFGAAKMTLTLPATPRFESLSGAVSDINSTSAVAQWLPTEGIVDAYQIDISTDSTFLDESGFLTGYNGRELPVQTVDSIFGLRPGTQYFLRLRSRNASGPSSYSQVVPFLTTPEQPTFDQDQVLTQVGQQTALISWNAVPEILDGYRITVSTDESLADSTQTLAEYTSRSIAKTRLSIQLQGLQPGTQYYAALTAFNSSGQSESSEVISVLTLPESPVFAADTAIVETTQNSAIIQWVAPAEIFDGYLLEVSTDFSFNNTNLMIPGYGRGGQPKLISKEVLIDTISGLMPGRRYYARVRSFNISGDSPNSNIIEFVTVPRAPVFNPAGNITQDAASISWSSTVGTETYLIDLNTSEDFGVSTALLTEFPTAVTFQVLNDLSPGTRYYARIQSSNASGSSGDMDPADYDSVSFITSPDVPLLNDPTQLLQTSVTLSWEPVLGAEGYEFDVSENFFQTSLAGYAQVSTTETQVIIDGLDPGSDYQFRVKSSNESGESSYAVNLELLTIPATPIARDATNSSASVFTVNWDPVSGADFYNVEVSPDNFQSFHYNEIVFASNPLQMTGLTAGATYRYRVQAGNESGTSPFSNEISVVAQNSAQALNFGQLQYEEELLPEDNLVPVSITLNGGLGNPEVLIRYKGVLSNEWSEPESMNRSGNSFSFEFTEFMFDEVGLEFEIYANDGITFIENLGNKIRRAFNESQSAELPALTFREWQMFSIPYILENRQVTGIFNELTSLDYKKQWRLMTYDNAAGSYIDAITGFANIELGTGYWLNVLQETTIRVGAGTTNTEIPYPINLKQGWNQIGNPFNSVVRWNEILAFNNATPVDNLYIYDLQQRAFINSSTLSPFNGALVWSDADISLDVFPSVAPPSFNGRISTAGTSTDLLEASEWELPIRLTSSAGTIDIAGVGMRLEADEQKDRFDRLTPPRFLNYVEMSTLREEAIYPYFSKDVIAPKSEQVWPFVLSSNHMAGEVTLEWDEFELNRYYGLWLVDERSGRIIDMKSQQSYRFFFQESSQLTIHYSEDPNYVVIPQLLSLGNPYPNPASKSAVIPLLLPDTQAEYQIDLSVYDMNGRKVKTLAKGPYAAGLHELSWILADDEKLKSGIYFYRLTFEEGDYPTIIKKLVIKR